MSDRNTRSASLSRRSVLGATTALPVLSGVTAPELQSVAAQCKGWLAVNTEIERLTMRWGDLDACLMRASDQARQSSSERHPAHIAEEMTKIDNRLDPLYQSRECGLETLAKHPARTLQDVAGKLTVAATMLEGEGGPIHDIVAEAAHLFCRERRSSVDL